MKTKFIILSATIEPYKYIQYLYDSSFTKEQENNSNDILIIEPVYSGIMRKEFLIENVENYTVPLKEILNNENALHYQTCEIRLA